MSKNVHEIRMVFLETSLCVIVCFPEDKPRGPWGGIILFEWFPKIVPPTKGNRRPIGWSTPCMWWTSMEIYPRELRSQFLVFDPIDGHPQLSVCGLTPCRMRVTHWVCKCSQDHYIVKWRICKFTPRSNKGLIGFVRVFRYFK